MAARKLFSDMASDLRKRFILALGHMSAWGTESRITSSVIAFDTRKCSDAYNNNIDEISYLWGEWHAYNGDGNEISLNAIDLELLGTICDWIERTYSPTHKCGDRRI